MSTITERMQNYIPTLDELISWSKKGKIQISEEEIRKRVEAGTLKVREDSDTKLKTSQNSEEQIATQNFLQLNSSEWERLLDLERNIRWHRFGTSLIDKKILPTFYDLDLFIGSTTFKNWEYGSDWVMKKGTSKYESLSIYMTLKLLTATLAQDDHHGADYWYRKGVTRKLVSHLIALREKA